MGKRTPLRERWERHVVKGDPDVCWEWIGSRNLRGYGKILARDASDRPRLECAHRVAYELFVAAIPRGMEIDHTCHNPPCVNPAHLRVVTSKQNQENLSGPCATNASGYRGVSLHKHSGLWRARAKHHGRDYLAGYFATPEEANEAAVALRNRLFTHNDADKRRAA
jgi:hypothetical protein